MNWCSFSILAGEDFGVTDISLFFPPESQAGDTLCTNISIIDDLAFEKDENFLVHAVSGPDEDMDDEYATVYIIDNDSM